MTIPSGFFGSSRFRFYLDGPLPVGLSAARTGGTIYQARSAGTVAVATSGADIWESREDGRGQWTFPAYANVIAAPNDFATGWTDFGTLTRTTGQSDPTGGTSATKLNDTSAAALATIWSGDRGSYGYDPISSVWVKDDVSSPPTASNIIGANDGGGSVGHVYCGFLTCQTLGTGTTWKRRHSKYSSSGVLQVPQVLISPAGQVPVYNAYASQANAPTGAVHLFGAMCFGGPSADVSTFDAPTLSGSSSHRVITADSGQLSQVLDGSDLDIEGSFYLADNFSSQTLAETRIVSLNTPTGITRLSLNTSIGWYAQFKGAAAFGDAISYGQQGQRMYWRLIHKPSENVYGYASRQNGCIAVVNLVASPGATIGTPTSVTLGASETGTLELPAMHSSWFGRSGKSTASIYDAEFGILGDSTSAPYTGTLALMGGLIYTDAEASVRRGIYSLAVTGNTVAQQKALWDASPLKGNANTRAVYINLGINNVATDTAASIIADLQALVTDINGANPSAGVIIAPMIPFGFTGANLTKWNTVNTAITGGGGTPITGSNLTRMAVWSTLDDGSGALKPEYLQDGHNNTLARVSVQAPLIRAAFVSGGYLP